METTSLRRDYSSTFAVGLFVVAVAAALAGCSDEVAGAGACADDEQWNPIDEQCVPAGEANNQNNNPFASSNNDSNNNDNQDDNQQDNNGDDNQNDDNNQEDDCEGQECDQVACTNPGENPTSITGTVTIPSGQLPLPDVNVYVPRAGTVESIEPGAECVRCEDELSADPLVETTTDVQGVFHLTDVPVADEVPLIIEVGKWRRQLTVENVQPCQIHPLDDEQTRLPRNQEEGDLPQIAVTTGGWDALECLMRKIGISASEFTTDDGDGRVHLFSGRGGTDRFDDSLQDGDSFTPAWDWWDEQENLMDYDIILHSCEGSPNEGDKPPEAREALRDFADEGGRVFLSHWQNIWLDEGPSDFASVANWGNNPVGGMDDTSAGYINTTFPKGELLHDWMHIYMNELPPSGGGDFEINEVRGTVDSLNEEVAQEWIWIEEDGSFGFGGGEFTQYFSFNTPVEAPEEQQCGRVVFSDIHVSAGDNSSPNNPFPNGCNVPEGDDWDDDELSLTAQEQALVFMFFDLSACIIADHKKHP